VVHRTYVGLCPVEAAVRAFEGLTPYVREMMEMQRGCPPFGADHGAVGIALDGLQTAAYHFTRRRDFYGAVAAEFADRPVGNGRLADRAEAVAAFVALRPYVDRLRALQGRCRPFGRDYLALDIAKASLETAAFHFTREAHFYAARSDSTGPLRPDR